MSSMHTIELDCPQCRKKSPFTIHDSINVSLDPEDKEKVLDRSLFIFQCPHCGFESCVQYGSLYHDMTNKYMISVCGDEETARNSPIPDIGDTYRPMEGLGGKMVNPYPQDMNAPIKEVSFLGGLFHGYRREPMAA